MKDLLIAFFKQDNARQVVELRKLGQTLNYKLS